MKRALSRILALAVSALVVLSTSPAFANLLTAGIEANVTSGLSLFPWAAPVAQSDSSAPGLVLSQELSGVLLPPFDVNGSWNSLAVAQYGVLSTRAAATTSGPLGYGANSKSTASWEDGFRIEGGSGSGYLFLSLDLHLSITDPGGAPFASGFSLTSDYCPNGCAGSWGQSGTLLGDAAYDETRLVLIPFQFGTPITIAANIFASASAFGNLTDVIAAAAVREAYVTNASFVRLNEAVIHTDSGADYNHLVPLTAVPAPMTTWLLLAGVCALAVRRRTVQPQD